MAKGNHFVNGADMDALNQASRERKQKRLMRKTGYTGRLAPKEDGAQYEYKEHKKWHEGVI